MPPNTKEVEKFVVSADGTKVFASAVGDPSNPALVFVHGYTLCSAIFSELFAKPENSKDHYLIRYDLRGHGRTGKPSDEEGYSSKRHAEDYAAVVKQFNAKTPIIVGWSIGGSIPGDVSAHLPPGSMHGAVYIASHPTLVSALPLAMLPTLPAIWGIRYDEKAGEDFALAFSRLCVSRDIEHDGSYLEETIKLNAEGADFVPENPTATYDIRNAMLGMASTMKPIHRRWASGHLGDDSKILDLLAEGFPILEVIGSHDAILNCDKIVELIKPIARNLDVHIVQGASHTPFVDAPDEVMGAVLGFARKVLAN